MVVDVAPAVEGLLRLGMAGECRKGEDLCLEAAMEAFVLAAALRVVGCGVDEVDGELEQPDAQLCPLIGHAGAPWRTVIGIDGHRQSVVTQDRLHPRVHGLHALVLAEAALRDETAVRAQLNPPHPPLFRRSFCCGRHGPVPALP